MDKTLVMHFFFLGGGLLTFFKTVLAKHGGAIRALILVLMVLSLFRCAYLSRLIFFILAPYSNDGAIISLGFFGMEGGN